MKNRLDKYDYFYSMLGNPEATFPTILAEVHKVRRGALAPFFSHQAVSRFSGRVQTYTDQFCEQIRACGERGEPVPMFFALRCLTVDIISEYVFGNSLHMLDRQDWGKDFYSAWRALWELSPLIRQFPFIMGVFNAMPRWMLAIVQPNAVEVIDMKIATDKLTREVLNADEATVQKRDQPTVLWEVAHSDILPPEEKTFHRLSVEANNILAAGFETAGATMTHLLYLVLANPDVKRKLLKELEEAIPDPAKIPGYQKLEKLPYLYAVVKETLRYVERTSVLQGTIC
jgi:cytochrome P450